MGSGACTPAALSITQALQQLTSSFRQHGAQAELLPAIRRAVQALKVRTVDRSYRYDFTENYVLLLGQELNYRPEILSAAMVQDPDLWVNGVLHHISGATLHKGRQLKRCFLKLCELLALPEVEGDVGVLVCSRLVRALSVFESRWVEYEEAYVRELIHIEALARQPLERAVEVELGLLSLEKLGAEPREALPPPRRHSQASSQLSLPRHRRTMASSCELQPMVELPAPRAVRSCELMDLATSATRHTARWRLLCELVRRVSELNACANARGKGRSDMTVEVLETAAQIFLEARTDSPGARARDALARSVLEGFLRVRRYLAEVSSRMTWIDPQLCCNEDLEAALLDWESAWDLGVTFLKPELCQALCGIAIEVAKNSSASLAQLLEDQDAEVFLILPRLVLLSGLREPKHLALPGWLLPELEEEDSSGAPGAIAAAKRTILESSLTWSDFIEQAVEGGEGTAFRALEALSMQMQRRKPEKWNRCSAQLMRCIAAERE